MRELIRTNDFVLVSYLEAVLADAGIAAVVLDGHTSIAQGSLLAIPRRVMVEDEDFAPAQRLLDAIQAKGGEATVTADALLGGRVRFTQPAAGYRAAIDPVLLAACVPADFTGRLVDLGCGAGAASLCVAVRAAGARIAGIERDAALAALAADNARANDVAARLAIVVGDIRAAGLAGSDPAPGSFDWAIANPPYLEAARADPSPNPSRRAATIENEATLADWIAAMLRLVRPKGTLAVIQRADRLGDLLRALDDAAGEVVVFPLWPRAGEAARRVLVRARKGIATPLRLAAGLVLHEGNGFSAAAQDVLAGAALTL
jgi:tRNA1(Val) A37 N6-methylase TrmN6